MNFKGILPPFRTLLPRLDQTPVSLVALPTIIKSGLVVLEVVLLGRRLLEQPLFAEG
jgi:hypothetical protein